MIAHAQALDPADLATLAAQAFGRTRQLAHAQLAPNLTIVQASPNFTAVFGSAEKSVNGRLLTDILWEFIGAEEALLAILDGTLPNYQIESINRDRADGSLGYYNFYIAPLDAGRPQAGLLLLVEDTTPSVRLEQQVTQDRNELRLAEAKLARANAEMARLNRYKSFLLSMVAHDMRSPLTAIRGYAALLLDDLPNPSSEDQHQSLAAISALTERLNGLIDNVLDLDQIEQGRLILHSAPCDLNVLAREIAQIYKAQVKLRGLHLELALSDQPVMLEADPTRLLQILHNLLSNAIKYSYPQGYIRLSTRLEQDIAVVSVADTGPGMTETQLANLFQLYYRTDEARHSKVVGTGLGLFIVATLVDAHHGRVEVASQPGQGATFTVRLPLRQPVA